MKASKLILAAILLLKGDGMVMAEAHPQKDDKSITAVALYQAFRGNKAEPYKTKTMDISGVATFVGPDPYALPSVELAETKGKSSRVLCVLPLKDYLKLRHVSKGDQVVMQGEVRGFSDEHDYVVVKNSKILTVNGKKP